VSVFSLIQGFLKVHRSLTALITHHSIMPELLPVPLNIHRHNPSFSDMDHDYAALQDYTQLMRDLILGEEADYQ
jgi:tensin